MGGELGVVGCRGDQLHPARPLLLREGQPEVLGEHMRVAAVLVGVDRRTAEDLAQPQRDVVGMIGRHVGEHRCEDRVVVHAAVEHWVSRSSASAPPAHS